MTACCGGAADATLEGTTWKLSKMEGIPATAIDGEADAFTLVFNAADTMVAGRTNCNRFFGKYEAGEGKLELGPLGMTRMACPDMEFENAFVQMLDEVDRYEISGTTLKFYDDQTLLAEFLAVTLEPPGSRQPFRSLPPLSLLHVPSLPVSAPIARRVSRLPQPRSLLLPKSSRTVY